MTLSQHLRRDSVGMFDSEGEPHLVPRVTITHDVALNLGAPPCSANSRNQLLKRH